MVERVTPSPEYTAAVTKLGDAEKRIITSHTTGTKVSHAKLDAVQYAHASLVYSKALKLEYPTTDARFAQEDIDRWTKAIVPLKNDDWHMLKQELLKDSWVMSLTSTEPTSSRAFKNLANSLP